MGDMAVDAGGVAGCSADALTWVGTFCSSPDMELP